MKQASGTMADSAAGAVLASGRGDDGVGVDIRLVAKPALEDVVVFCNHTGTGRETVYIRQMPHSMCNGRVHPR